MAGWLESLGNIFSRDDDLETADNDAPEKKNHLENINAWDVPFNASPDDRVTGQNDAGQLVYKTITGNTYTVSVNPDQRNPQEKLIEGAKAVGTAVLDYGADPFIPSKEQVGEFAVNAIKGTTDQLNDMMFKGEGTIGDLVGAATFKAGAGLTASKLVPPTDAGSYMGMFLNRNAAKGKKYDSDYDKALDMEMNGIDRDTIWKETGWGKVFGEWMTETNDSITTTKGVQDAGTDLAPRYKLDAVTEENVVSKAVNAHKTKTAINLKYKELYRLAMKNPNEDARRAEIENLENQARIELEAASSPVNTETIKVSTNLKPTKIKPAKLKKKGTIEDVLGNADEIFDLVPENIDTVAEAGLRKGSSVKDAGENFGNYGGVHYRTRDWDGNETSNIRAFKNYGPKDVEGPFVQRNDGTFGYVRNAADVDTANVVLKELEKIRLVAKEAMTKLKNATVSDDEYSKISTAILVRRDAAMKKIYDAGKEDYIWSTMLHETQHWLDDIFESRGGTGANWEDKDRRASIQLSAKAEYRKELNKLEDKYGSSDPDAVTPELRNQLLNELDALNSGPKGMAADINNKGFTNLEYYYRDGGETKSRLVQSRRRLNFDERRNTPPWVTLSKMMDGQLDAPAANADITSNVKKYPTSESEIWTPARFKDPYYDYTKNPIPKDNNKNFWEVDDLSASVTNQTDDLMNTQMSKALDASPIPVASTPIIAKDILKDAPSNAQEVLGITEEMKQTWRSERPKKKQQRTPQLQEGINAMLDNEITYNEYLELADTFRPIKPITKVPTIPTTTDIVSSLKPDQIKKGIIGVTKEIEEGTRVASRLDISAYENFDTWVVSLHDGVGESLGGASVAHGQVAVLTNVNFKTIPKAAANIGSGKGKATIARIFGDYNKANPQEVYERALELINDTSGEWVQVGMNPFRHSFFYDKVDGMPVTSATEVIQIGPLVLAKNVKKVARDDPMFAINPKNIDDPRRYYEGGLVSPLGAY